MEESIRLIEEGILRVKVFNLTSMAHRQYEKWEFKETFMDTFSARCVTINKLVQVNKIKSVVIWRCVTYVFHIKIDSSDLWYEIEFLRDKLGGLKISVHDPKFYSISYNPDVIPRTNFLSENSTKNTKECI